jgi:hypothetical protein
MINSPTAQLSRLVFLHVARSQHSIRSLIDSDHLATPFVPFHAGVVHSDQAASAPIFSPSLTVTQILAVA